MKQGKSQEMTQETSQKFWKSKVNEWFEAQKHKGKSEEDQESPINVPGNPGNVPGNPGHPGNEQGCLRKLMKIS
jgi:hypothetical protein